MRLKCVRVNCVTNQAITEEHIAELRYSEGNQSWWIHLTPGVTGYESASVKDLLRDNQSNGWCACAGTPMSWDSLRVNQESLEQLKDYLRLIYPILQRLPNNTILSS